jgi:hypothetical protein
MYRLAGGRLAPAVLRLSPRLGALNPVGPRLLSTSPTALCSPAVAQQLAEAKAVGSQAVFKELDFVMPERPVALEDLAVRAVRVV